MAKFLCMYSRYGIKQQAREIKTSTRAQKNGMKVIASAFACTLPNGSAEMTQSIKKHSVEGSKTNSGILALEQSRQTEA